jgi:tetratricopeptide (TPR) repeat protein
MGSNLRQLFEKAEKYNRKNQIDKAKELYNIIINTKSSTNNHIEKKLIKQTFIELSKIYKTEKNIIQAKDCLEKALTINPSPNDHNIIHEIAGFNVYLGEVKLGLKQMYSIVKTHPTHELFYNISYCYFKMNEFGMAKKNLLKSIELKKDYTDALFSVVEMSFRLKDYDDAIMFYNMIDKDRIEIKHHMNAGFAYLGNKNFKKGFELYQYRLSENNISEQTNVFDRIEISTIPYWDGKTLCNSILIIGEQGYGDCIQFYRFILDLCNKYPDINFTYLITPNLINIFEITHKNFYIISKLNKCDVENTENYQFKLYIMSIPFYLGIDTIVPNTINYIKVNNDKNDFWCNNLSNLKKLRVGFTYKGFLKTFIEKTISLEKLQPLADLDIELICLHKKEEVINDIESISFRDKIHLYDIDTDEPFQDTIAILRNIDLLISVDTFIVHLAGVLGIKTILMLGRYSDWRWSTDNKSYWFNNLDIVRSDEPFKIEKTIPELVNKVKRIIEEK